MNKKFKKSDKGITLVALIITIIMLVILAVVTINSVKGDGIIAHAENAKNKYQDAQAVEQDMLSKYEYDLAKMQGKVTGSEGEYYLNKYYGENVKVGDYVDYNVGEPKTWTADTNLGAFVMETLDDNGNKQYTGGEYTTQTGENALKWRILGATSTGELELISDTATTDKLGLYGENGWFNAKIILNEFCNNLYGKGEFAKSARSLNAEDINRLTGFNPNTYEVKENLDDGTTGTIPYKQLTWKYRYNNGRIEYLEPNASEWKKYTDMVMTGEEDVDLLTILRENGTKDVIDSTNPGEKEVKYTKYSYTISEFLKDDRSNIEDMLSKGSEKLGIGIGASMEAGYWLASQSVDPNCINRGGALDFDVRCVRNGSICISEIMLTAAKRRVRPVVTLKSQTKLVTTDKDGSETSPYTLQAK